MTDLDISGFGLPGLIAARATPNVSKSQVIVTALVKVRELMVTVSASVSASSLDDWDAMNDLMRRLLHDAEQEWLKAFVRRAKKGILRALTEDYKYQGSDGKTKHNLALFNKTGKWQVYNGTDLTMVMDAVVAGLYAAYGESVDD